MTAQVKYHIVKQLIAGEEPTIMMHNIALGFATTTKFGIPDGPREQFTFDLPEQPLIGEYVRLTKDEQTAFWEKWMNIAINS